MDPLDPAMPSIVPFNQAQSIKSYALVCNPQQASNIESMLSQPLLSCQRVGPKSQWREVIQCLTDHFVKDQLKFYFAEDTAFRIVANLPVSCLVLCADFHFEISIGEIHDKLKQAMNMFWESDDQFDRGRIVNLPNGCQYTIQELTIKIYTSPKRHLGISTIYGFQVDVITQEIRCGEGFRFIDTADRISRILSIRDKMRLSMECNLTEDCHQNPEALTQMLHGIQRGYSFRGNQRLLLQTALSRQGFEKEFAAYLDVQFGDDRIGKIFTQLNLLTLTHLHNVPLDSKSLPLPPILIKIHRLIGPLFLSITLGYPNKMDDSAPSISFHGLPDKNRRIIHAILLKHLGVLHYCLCQKPQQALLEGIEFLSSNEVSWQEIREAFSQFFHITLSFVTAQEAIAHLTAQLNDRFIINFFEYNPKAIDSLPKKPLPPPQNSVSLDPNLQMGTLVKNIDSFILMANQEADKQKVLSVCFALLEKVLSQNPMYEDLRSVKIQLVNLVGRTLCQPIQGESDPLLYRSVKNETEEKESAEVQMRYLFDKIPWSKLLANDEDIIQVVVKSIETVFFEWQAFRSPKEMQHHAAALICSTLQMLKQSCYFDTRLPGFEIIKKLNTPDILLPIVILNTYINIFFVENLENSIPSAINFALKVCKRKKDVGSPKYANLTQEELNSFILNFINNVVKHHTSINFKETKELQELFELILKTPTQLIFKQFLVMLETLLTSSNVRQIKLAINLILKNNILNKNREIVVKFKNKFIDIIILILEKMYKLESIPFCKNVCLTMHFQIKAAIQANKDFRFFETKIIEFLKMKSKLPLQITDLNTFLEFLCKSESLEHLYILFQPAASVEIIIQLFSQQQKFAKFNFPIISRLMNLVYNLFQNNFYPTDQHILDKFEDMIITLIQETLHCNYEIQSFMIQVFHKLISHFQYNDKTIKKAEQYLKIVNVIGDRLFDMLAFRSHADHVECIMVYEEIVELIADKIKNEHLIAQCITPESYRIARLAYEVFVFKLVVNGAKEKYKKTPSTLPYSEFLKSYYKDILTSQEDEKLQAELILKIQIELRNTPQAAKALLLGIGNRIEKFENNDLILNEYALIHAGFLINNYFLNKKNHIGDLKFYFNKQTEQLYNKHMMHEVITNIEFKVIKFGGVAVFHFVKHPKTKELVPLLTNKLKAPVIKALHEPIPK